MFFKKEIAKINVDGMMCDHCKMRVEKALNELDGLKFKVDLKNKCVLIYDFNSFGVAQIKEKIVNCGYSIVE